MDCGVRRRFGSPGESVARLADGIGVGVINNNIRLF